MNRSNKSRALNRRDRSEKINSASSSGRMPQIKIQYPKTRSQKPQIKQIPLQKKTKKIEKVALSTEPTPSQHRRSQHRTRSRLEAKPFRKGKQKQKKGRSADSGIEIQVQLPIKQSVLEHCENYIYSIKVENTKQIERKEIPDKKWTGKLIQENLKLILKYILGQLNQQFIKQQINQIIVEYATKKTRIQDKSKKQFISTLALQTSKIFNSFKQMPNHINQQLIGFNRMFFPKLNFPPKIYQKQLKNIQEQKTIDQQKQRNNQNAELTEKVPVCQCGYQLCCRKCAYTNCLKMLVFCDNNNCRVDFNRHYCDKINENFRDKVEIIGRGKILTQKQFKFQAIKGQQVQNNIYETVQKNGYKWISQYKYSTDIPSVLQCQFPIISQNSSFQILDNRQNEKFLPLEIRKSDIKDAGLGVFAKMNINLNTLVCSYIGQIGISSSVSVTKANKKSSKEINDSIFTIGWIGKELVFIRPSFCSNVGRFINYNDPKRCNIKPNLCLIQNKNKQLEVCVFFTTIRKIESGEQLFYDYGEEYTK